MVGKLLALLLQAKGAAVGTVLVIAGATTVTVTATNPEVQDTVNQIVANVGLTQRDSCDKGQPAVVAQRNAADKLLRDAWSKDHKKLDDLRGGGKDVDAKAVGVVVRSYDELLRARLNTALNDVAALTLGRDGQNEEHDSTRSTGSTGTCPAARSTGSTGSTGATGSTGSSGTSGSTVSTGATGSSADEDKGRVAVANRTTLDAAIKAKVDEAIADMDKLVTDAATAVSEVPAPERGKPSDQQQGNKPDDKGAKPEDKGKPSR